MEIRVYKNASDFANRKYKVCERVLCNDFIKFPYESCVCAFKAIYGSESVVEFIIL